MTVQSHRFFCCKCGNEGIPLLRQRGHQHQRFHKKKLWCLNCKDEINHIEIKNNEEMNIFLDNFKNGVYVNAT